jgi:short-subunit dehydrogenase involved in D-alanine esterification of teichoic acids
MHHLILTLREQLNGSNVKVIEILPPAVQTELHDKKHQPDLENGGSFGMPIGGFTDETWKGLKSGKTDIPVGRSRGSYEGWEATRQDEFRKMVEMLKKGRK